MPTMPRLASGVTVALFEEPAVASCAVLGGAPGTRETDLLEPDAVAPGVDAVVLSGGSAFGLDAASGVQALLRERGIGFPVGPVRVPLVPQAIVFDLLNGGDKDWGRYPPYRELGYAAAAAARARLRARHRRRRLRRHDLRPQGRPRLGERPRLVRPHGRARSSSSTPSRRR